MKRVILVHGWRGRADRGWLGRLADELRQQGIEVIDPRLPEPPRGRPFSELVEALRNSIGELDADTVLVGHSMGVPLILRLLDEQPDQLTVAGIVLVAGFYAEPGSRRGEYFGSPDFTKIVAKVPRRFCIYSDDDPLVEPASSQRLAQVLEAESIILPGRRHFDNFEERDLPEALSAVLACFES